jgi:hypothetical protein
MFFVLLDLGQTMHLFCFIEFKDLKKHEIIKITDKAMIVVIIDPFYY